MTIIEVKNIFEKVFEVAEKIKDGFFGSNYDVQKVMINPNNQTEFLVDVNRWICGGNDGDSFYFPISLVVSGDEIEIQNHIETLKEEVRQHNIKLQKQKELDEIQRKITVEMNNRKLYEEFKLKFEK